MLYNYNSNCVPNEMVIHANGDWYVSELHSSNSIQLSDSAERLFITLLVFLFGVI